MSQPFPFSAIVGQAAMKQAMVLTAIDPGIGGVLVFGDRGTGKSTAVRALAARLPEITAVEGCPVNSARLEDVPDWAGPKSGKLVKRPSPVIDLLLAATEDRVVGALDIERAPRAAQIPSLVIDIANRPQPALKRLADSLDAPYLPLPRADARRLSVVLQQALATQMQPPKLPADWPYRAASRHIAAKPRLWHVQDVGAGPVLLLIHGAGGATHSFRHLIPLVTDQYRVIAVDVTGQGLPVQGTRNRCGLDAIAQDMATLILQENWPPKAIIGHSAGAAIALGLAKMIPTHAVIGINAALGRFGPL